MITLVGLLRARPANRQRRVESENTIGAKPIDCSKQKIVDTATTYEYSATGHLQKATYADGREECRLSEKVANLLDDPDCKLRKYLRGGVVT